MVWREGFFTRFGHHGRQLPHWLNRVGEAFDALVYYTTGFGPCPADEFAAIDVRQLAADTGSELAWKNPRRTRPGHWTGT